MIAKNRVKEELSILRIARMQIYLLETKESNANAQMQNSKENKHFLFKRTPKEFLC